MAIAAKQLQHKLNVSKILIVDWVRTHRMTSITGPHMDRNKQTNTHMFLSVYLSDLQGPRSKAALFRSTPIYHLVHLGTGLISVHHMRVYISLHYLHYVFTNTVLSDILLHRTLITTCSIKELLG